MLPEIIGKWYTRKPIADSTGVVPQPSTSVVSLEVKDNEDYEKCVGAIVINQALEL